MEIKEVEEEIKNCRKCRLWKSRKNAVPGEGNYNAILMFVGEAPGKTEDEQGKPFVGKAGQLLNEILKKNGIERKEIYITNVVKCRPPGNRNPLMDEIEACFPYLKKQIEIIRPKVIATLGNFGTKVILEMYGFKSASISRIRGKIFNSPLHGVKIIPTFHPAACIYNPKLVEKFEEDIEKIVNLLERI
ncbi:uracil-DNA glycosylase [Thermoplasmatales archaeon ex4484_30]|nr:MAG: uracil-DNA glycosylase [Thermoplasmatales archaeon ex4484_30]